MRLVVLMDQEPTRPHHKVTSNHESMRSAPEQVQQAQEDSEVDVVAAESVVAGAAVVQEAAVVVQVDVAAEAAVAEDAK